MPAIVSTPAPVIVLADLIEVVDYMEMGSPQMESGLGFLGEGLLLRDRVPCGVEAQRHGGNVRRGLARVKPR